ncbi:MAG: MFS transporter [Clostridiaceae bacterium]|nr:MFS transporter [Eubacteriales bacterium]
MRKSYGLLILLNNFATGVMSPVLTLALLAHGASIQNVSLFLGIYSLTVIAAEFPSGVFADLCGRKKAYLVSAALRGISCCALLLSNAVPMLAAAMVLQGLGRAFSSGSIDALAMDEAVSSGGEIVKVSAQISVMESVGLAAGALAGGLISGLGARYEGNLATTLALSALVFLGTAIFVREVLPPRAEGEALKLKHLGVQVRESLSFAAQGGTVRMLLVFSALTGFALISIETYWQPALLSLSPLPAVFGAVSFFGFACVVLGSKLAERLLTRCPRGGVAASLGLKALFGACLGLLALPGKTLPFVGVYALLYLFLGSGGVAESALLNQQAPPEQRASILSLFSFALQIGGLLASLCGALVSAHADFRYLWYLAGGLLLLGVAAFTLLRVVRYAKARSDAGASGKESA